MGSVMSPAAPRKGQSVRVSVASPSPKASLSSVVAQSGAVPSRAVPLSGGFPSRTQLLREGEGLHCWALLEAGALKAQCRQASLTGTAGQSDEAFSLAIILPALQMPKSQGNLCCAQFGSGCGFPGIQEVVSCKQSRGKPGEKAQCDLSRLAKLHSDVPSPVPAAASMGQCLAQIQLVSPGALGTCNHLGSSPVWTIQAPSDPDGFEQKKEDDAKTISHNRWWSWSSFTQSPVAADSTSVGGVGRAPLPSPAMARCDIAHQPLLPNLTVAVLPRAHGVTPAGGNNPSLVPLHLECCKASSWCLCWDFTELGSPGSAQPCSFSPVTLSQGSRELGWASHHLRFFWGNAEFLSVTPLPNMDGMGWGLQ